MEADEIKLFFMIIIYVITVSLALNTKCMSKRGEGDPTLLKHKLRAVSKNWIFTKNVVSMYRET